MNGAAGEREEEGDARYKKGIESRKKGGVDQTLYTVPNFGKMATPTTPCPGQDGGRRLTPASLCTHTFPTLQMKIGFPTPFPSRSPFGSFWNQFSYPPCTEALPQHSRASPACLSQGHIHQHLALLCTAWQAGLSPAEGRWAAALSGGRRALPLSLDPGPAALTRTLYWETEMLLGCTVSRTHCFISEANLRGSRDRSQRSFRVHLVRGDQRGAQRGLGAEATRCQGAWGCRLLLPSSAPVLPRQARI